MNEAWLPDQEQPQHCQSWTLLSLSGSSAVCPWYQAALAPLLEEACQCGAKCARKLAEGGSTLRPAQAQPHLPWSQGEHLPSQAGTSPHLGPGKQGFLAYGACH